MPVYLLNDQPIFPPVTEAEPDGLVAVGGDLSIERLLVAYSSGIFPWFEYEELPYWFSPDPRMVLIPGQFKISNSLHRTIKGHKFEVRIDTSFRRVITKCSQVERKGEDGSWITRSFINAYSVLHKEGFAHSFETYYKGELVGGLYGVSLGSAFFGESMFYTMPDASKVAFAHLVDFTQKHGFLMIDCQQETEHLKRMGACAMERTRFLHILNLALQSKTLIGKWRMAD